MIRNAAQSDERDESVTAPLATIRASSWPTLFSCAMRWYYQQIEGLRTPASGAAWTGTSIHRATAHLDAPVVRDEPPGDLEEAADIYIHTINHPDEEVRWTADDTPRREAEANGLRLLGQYARAYTATRQWTGVEMAVEPLDIATDYGIVRLTGTPDRLFRNEGNQLCIADIKTGKSAAGADGIAPTAGHHLQLGVYALLAGAALGEPVDGPGEIIGWSLAGKAPRLGSGTVADPRAALVGDDKHAGLIEMAARMLRDGMFPPNPKDLLCSEKYCPGWGKCHYRSR